MVPRPSQVLQFSFFLRKFRITLISKKYQIHARKEWKWVYKQERIKRKEKGQEK